MAVGGRAGVNRNAARIGRYAGWAAGAGTAAPLSYGLFEAGRFLGTYARHFCGNSVSDAGAIGGTWNEFLSSGVEVAGDVLYYGLPAAGIAAGIAAGAWAAPRARRFTREFIARVF